MVQQMDRRVSNVSIEHIKMRSFIVHTFLFTWLYQYISSETNTIEETCTKMRSASKGRINKMAL